MLPILLRNDTAISEHFKPEDGFVGFFDNDSELRHRFCF